MTKTIKRRGVLQAAAAVGAGLASPGLVRAQDALESLKIIVGFPPGGSADVVSRHLGEKLVPGYARSVIVDNRPGAAGRIAIEMLKNSAARRPHPGADAGLDGHGLHRHL